MFITTIIVWEFLLIPVYTISESPAEWTFTLPSGYVLEYFIRSVEDLDNDIADNLSGISFLQQNENTWTVSVFPAAEKTYWLYLKANNQIDDDVYIVVLFLEKSGEESVSQSMPLQVFPVYADYGIELISPFEGTVFSDSTYNFRLYTGEEDMDRVILYQYESIEPVVVDGFSDFAETSPGLWELIIEIPEGLVQLNVNILPPEKSSITILKYLCLMPSGGL